MVPGIDPKVDIAFKKVFGSEAFQDLTISLINAVLAPPPDRAVVSVQLPKFRKPLERLRKSLDFWLYLLKNGDQLDADSPPEPLNRPDQRRALEVLKMLSQSELEREQYESRVRAQMDWDTLEALKRMAE